MTDGLIYFVLDADRHKQRVKIGFTTNLRQRLEQLREQTVTRCQPILLALTDGTQDDERAIHREFASLRLHGEWFSYEGTLIDYIGDMDNPVGWLLDNWQVWPYAGGAFGCPRVVAVPPHLAALPDPPIIRPEAEEIAF